MSKVEQACSGPKVQSLIGLIEDLIAKEPYEAFGLKWAARPQAYYCDALGVSEWTLRRCTKKPPFARKNKLIDGKKVCLLRVGEGPPNDPHDSAKRVMIKLRNSKIGKQVTRREGSCLYFFARDITMLAAALGVPEDLGGELAIACSSMPSATGRR